MRVATAIVALTLVSVHAQITPTESALIVVDAAHSSADDRERLTRLARAIAPDAETRVWTGLRDDPVAKYQLSFTEAFDIFRGNASVLQTVRARECADGVPSCGADLPVRARQSLDAFDEVARATVSQLVSAANDLAARARPRPHAVVFVTAGLPYRTEPRRELEALRDAMGRVGATLAVVDAVATGRPSAIVARMSAVAGGTRYVANDESLRQLQATLAPVAGPAVPARKGEPAEVALRLPPEVSAASKHAVAFAESAETLLADEHYVQEVKTRPSATSKPRYSSAGITTEKRTLDSEVALIQLRSGEVWLLARDVQRINDRPVDDAQRVPLPLARAGSEAEALKQLQDIARQGARFNVGGIRRDLNVPTLALWLLIPSVLPRFEFSVAGRQVIEGRSAVVVRFKERRPPYLFVVNDESVPAMGRFWLDRERGAVIRTELVLQSAPGGQESQAHIVVNYRFDAKSEAWVPRDMTERYNAALTPEFVIATATYSNVRRFSSTVRVVK